MTIKEKMLKHLLLTEQRGAQAAVIEEAERAIIQAQLPNANPRELALALKKGLESNSLYGQRAGSRNSNATLTTMYAMVRIGDLLEEILARIPEQNPLWFQVYKDQG